MWRRLIYHPEINYALRQTLVLCLPVAVGLIIGQLHLGLLFSLVLPAAILPVLIPRISAFQTLSDWRVFVCRMQSDHAITAGTDYTAATDPHRPDADSGVTAELGPLHARLLPASLIAAIFTLSLAGNMPVWEPLLIYALGTLWYGLFNWFWFWMWREQPLRESLSLLYRELADYCEAKYSMLTQHADPEKRCLPCWCASKSGGFNYPVLSANAYAVGASQQRL